MFELNDDLVTNHPFRYKNDNMSKWYRMNNNWIENHSGFKSFIHQVIQNSRKRFGF